MPNHLPSRLSEGREEGYYTGFRVKKREISSNFNTNLIFVWTLIQQVNRKVKRVYNGLSRQ